MIDHSKVRFTHDESRGVFRDASGVTVDDGQTSFTWDEIETVTIEDGPVVRGFDTDEFYKLPATVARPVAQPYTIDDIEYTFMKPREELERAAWSLHNAPWTLGHPPTRMVRDSNEVKGFWRDPVYDTETDELNANLFVPVTDEEAREYIEDNQDVSVGFYNKTASVDDYDGEVGGSVDNKSEIDAYQTDIYFDHIASVQNGRCSLEDGCGLQVGVDEVPKMYNKDHEDVFVEVDTQTGDGNHVFVRSHYNAEAQYFLAACEYLGDGEFGDVLGSTGPMESDYAPINPITFMLDEPLGHEQDFAIVMFESNDGEMGDIIIDHGEPVYDSAMYEYTARNRGENVTYDHAPFVDAAEGRYGNTLYENKDGSFISATHITHDYRDEEGKYYAVGPEENPDGVPKYPIDSCTGEDSVESAWKLRNHGDISISVTTLEERIKRRATQLDCDSSPWDDGETDSIDTMTKDTDCGGLGIDALSVDAVAAKHGGVREALDEKEEQIEELEAKIDEMEEENEELEEQVSTYEEEEKRGLVNAILEMTEALGTEEELMAMELGELEDAFELIQSIAGSEEGDEDDPEEEEEEEEEGETDSLGSEDVTANADSTSTPTVRAPKRKTPWS